MHIAVFNPEIIGVSSYPDILKKFGTVTHYIYKKDYCGSLHEMIYDAAVVVSSKILFNSDLLDQLPNLRLICVPATGTNNVDLEVAKSHGIAVYNVAGYSTECVVQHTFAMLFYLLEKLPTYDAYVKERKYIRRKDYTYMFYPFWEIHGKQLGVIGLGAIGKRVAQVAESFGMSVCYTSASGNPRKEAYPHLDLDSLISTSDVISIHAPISSKTRNLIGTQELMRMKTSSIILNLGRGGIINEKALADALDAGEIAAAGLDVLEKEPMREDHPLLNIRDPKRLLITPHIAWGSSEARMRLAQQITKNIENFLSGKVENRIV